MLQHRIGITGILLAALSAFATGAIAQSNHKPKLLEWGYDQPTTRDLRNNIQQMERSPFDGTPTPFDGVVLAANTHNGRQLASLFWTGVTFQQADFQNAVNDLQATKFRYLTDNFLRINVQNAPWFDDAYWASILNNARIATWICQQGGLKGVVLDTEQYNYAYLPKTKTYSGTYLFCYRAMALDEVAKTGKAHTFEDYVAQAHRRGVAFAQALTDAYPQMVVLMSHSSSDLSHNVTLDADRNVSIQTHGFSQPLQWGATSLFPAFLDGMLEGAKRSAEFVDLMEIAYPLRADGGVSTPFELLSRGLRSARHYSQSPQTYTGRMSFGFGLWMNYMEVTNDEKGMRFRIPWDPQTPELNYFTPDLFRQTLEAALATTDRYAFLYTQSGYRQDASGYIRMDAQGNPLRTLISWWTGEGLSADYVRCVQQAHPR